MKKFTFVDLFAGIGGFHQAMNQLGGKCVFASEIDKYAIETYQKNFNMNSNYDICNVNLATEQYEVLNVHKVSDEEMEARRAKWQPREPKVTTGYLSRYEKMVTSGNRGAILE